METSAPVSELSITKEERSNSHRYHQEHQHQHLVVVDSLEEQEQEEQLKQLELDAVTLVTEGEMTESESASHSSNASEDSATMIPERILMGEELEETKLSLKDETFILKTKCLNTSYNNNNIINDDDDHTSSSSHIDPENQEYDQEEGEASVNEDETKPYSQEQLKESASTPAKRPSSILKLDSEPLHIKESKSVWKCLGKPDMDMVRRTSESRMLAYQQRQSITTCNNSQEEPGMTRRSRSVVFGDVQIRDYLQTLGDNPSVSYGPPISLDWDYEEFEPLSLDEYEDTRRPRRTIRQMVLSFYQRQNILSWQYGFSCDVLRDAKRKVKREHLRRDLTRALLPAMHVEAAVESMGRKAKRLFGGGNKKKEAES